MFVYTIRFLCCQKLQPPPPFAGGAVSGFCELFASYHIMHIDGAENCVYLVLLRAVHMEDSCLHRRQLTMHEIDINMSQLPCWSIYLGSVHSCCAHLLLQGNMPSDMLDLRMIWEVLWGNICLGSILGHTWQIIILLRTWRFFVANAILGTFLMFSPGA